LRSRVSGHSPALAPPGGRRLAGLRPSGHLLASGLASPCTPGLAFPSPISLRLAAAARALSCDVSQQSVQSLAFLPLVALGSAMAVGCFNHVLSPLVPSPPGRRVRAALRCRWHRHPLTAVSLRRLPCGAAAGRGTRRLAAAAESQAVQEQPARAEEAGGAGAAEASSKLVLVVGGTGGVGEIPRPLLPVLQIA
jgi:hypothetical protein